MSREAGPCSIAMDIPSPSSHLSRLHWPWWAGTMTHRHQREEHQDDLNPAEKGKATSLEQWQSPALGPSLNEAYWLLTKWQGKDTEKITRCAKSPVLLMHQGVSCIPPQQQPAHQSGATDIYHLMHTCKYPVFLCLTNWETSMAAMRKVHVLILLSLWVRHNSWMHKRWILFSDVWSCFTPPPSRKSRLTSAARDHPLFL